jgi:diguanylate cyclase
MKHFLKTAYLSDHALEVIFSSLRWFFLLMSLCVFSYQYMHNPVAIKLNLFLFLVFFGILYMGISDYYLHRSPEGSRIYTIMTKGGPCFDIIAFSALIPLTGGFQSPLFPVAYLIILHVTVYWRFIGGFITAFLFIFIYSIIFFMQVGDVLSSNHLITYGSQVLFLLMIGGLGGIIVSRERKHHSDKNVLAEAASRDYLTNLLNHRSFQEDLRKEIENGTDFYLVLTDIDKFKSVNDQFGHVLGDQVLLQIGVIMSSIIPEKLGKVFRYGGEEFAIILYTNKHHVVNKLLVEIKQTIAQHVFYSKEKAFSVTMSFGSCKQNGEMSTQLVEKVDKLLYEAKDRGRNQIVYSNAG